MNTLFAFILFPLDSSLATYSTLFFMLILGAVGLPIPEEITLLLGGYLSYLEFIDYWDTIFILIAGIIVSDMLTYFLGRYVGDWLWQRVFGKWRLLNAILKKAKYYFEKHGERVVIFSRPIVGVRIAVPMLAGYFRMNLWKFLLYDITAAIPWVFFLVTAGYYLGPGIDFFTAVHDIKYEFYALIVLLVIMSGAIKLLRQYRPFAK